MKNYKAESNVKEINQVFTTTDYFLFKPIEGNRNLNLLHLNRLKNSISQNYLFTIIIVNKNYEIIDGQHRFECIKDLQLPLNYIICDNYGLKEVHILNQNSKTWNADDYLEGYCKLGYEHYIEYLKFKNKFNFGHNECLLLLQGNDCGHNIKEFYNGNFVIKDFKKAYENANFISMVGKFYDGYKRQTFVRAMNQILKKPQFDIKVFMQKLNIQPNALKDCSNTMQYKLLIEEIYNYKSREKVNLRY